MTTHDELKQVNSIAALNAVMPLVAPAQRKPYTVEEAHMLPAGVATVDLQVL